MLLTNQYATPLQVERRKQRFRNIHCYKSKKLFSETQRCKAVVLLQRLHHAPNPRLRTAGPLHAAREPRASGTDAALPPRQTETATASEEGRRLYTPGLHWRRAHRPKPRPPLAGTDTNTTPTRQSIARLRRDTIASSSVLIHRIVPYSHRAHALTQILTLSLFF